MKERQSLPARSLLIWETPLYIGVSNGWPPWKRALRGDVASETMCAPSAWNQAQTHSLLTPAITCATCNVYCSGPCTRTQATLWLSG
jgi:hypothetical protein